MKKGVIGFLLGAFTVLIIFCIFYSGNEAADNDLPQGIKQEDSSAVNPYKNVELTIQIIPGPNNTFGYDIMMEERILIHQPHAPGLPGVEGFKREEDARKVAKFVIGKIRNNIFPPSVTVDELDSLGIF